MFKKPMFILDLANNHIGSVEKGLDIINQHHEIIEKYKDQFNFAFKFQYRNLDTYIHNNYKGTDHKYVKRFSETKLYVEDEYAVLKDRIEELGYYTACTPFDEISVDKIKEQNFDIIKIASASMCDWSLFKEIAKLNKPVIMSTAGATLEEIDKAVMFFMNREVDLKLMHCVGIYPSSYKELQLNQIDVLKKLYPDIEVGFSTHEDPENFQAVKIAIGKGCRILERHIDIKCDTINAYSSFPEEIYGWLNSAEDAFEMCGVENQRHEISIKEISDLAQFKRGIFVNKDIGENIEITSKDVYYAWPTEGAQMLASEYSKYHEIESMLPIKKDEPLSIIKNVVIKDKEILYKNIIKDIIKIISQSNITLPNVTALQLSHHYGIENYYDTGVAIIESILHDKYAKKLLVMLPDQEHPLHFHPIKIESFQLLYGDFTIHLENDLICLKLGETYTIENGEPHGFTTKNGCVFEEVSTASLPNDSIYEDQAIMENYNNRKTLLKVEKKYFDKE